MMADGEIPRHEEEAVIAEGSDASEGEEALVQETIKDGGAAPSKKKKKPKKKKKSAAAKVAAAAAAVPVVEQQPAHNVLKISRAKHWKYISSFHGQWLSLPYELLETLLLVNVGPEGSNSYGEGPAFSDERFASVPPEERSRIPAPIDAAAFRSVVEIRKLVEEASDLAIRAASGLSAAALGALNDNPSAYLGGPEPMLNSRHGIGINSSNARGQTMSSTRQFRLRAMAVSKLAKAYKIDEIAASVAVMQGATALDDLPGRVLKQDPDNLDAQYVYFFHEKIPSRTLAKSSIGDVLDNLITSQPQHIQYYRTKGVVHGFRQEYAQAVDSFTQAIHIARSQREPRSIVPTTYKKPAKSKSGKGKKRQTASHTNGISTPPDEDDGESNFGDSSTTPTKESSSVPARGEAAAIGLQAGDDLERQCYFYRGMMYYHWAFWLLEDAVLAIEKVPRPAGGLCNESGESTISAIGIPVPPHKGLLGIADAEKIKRYEETMGHPDFKDRVMALFKKAAKDHERFLSYFPVWEAPAGSEWENDKKLPPALRADDRWLNLKGRRAIQQRSLNGRTRHWNDDNLHVPEDEEITLLTTYHPLMVESHFALLTSNLLLGELTQTLRRHYRLASILNNLEGFPVFLPARSLCQSQYSELSEQLAATWCLEREARGIQAPQGKEDDVAGQGELPSLHHLVSFFSAKHEEKLTRLAADMEIKDVKPTTKKPLLLGDIKKAKEQFGSLKHDLQPQPVRGSARAEIALAWLQVVILKEKEDEEAAQREEADRLDSRQSSSPGPESSSHAGIDSKGKGKGKQRDDS